MGANYPTRIMLAFRSGGVCAFDGCPKKLTYESESGNDTYVAEAAHIRGEKPGAARYDASMTDAERNSIHNLIYLCADHHRLIDKVEQDWSTEYLTELKESHEGKVVEAMEARFADVAFPELERAILWVKDGEYATQIANFDLSPPDEKIKKNDLSASSRAIILGGMTARETVAAFVEAESQINPHFADRLRAGFLAEYWRLKSEGVEGDALFAMMCDFAEKGSQNTMERTASVAVLIYLFEICDVFEK